MVSWNYHFCQAYFPINL